MLIGPWWPAKKTALVRNYLEVYWPCAGGLSAVNAIGMQLRDNIVFWWNKERRLFSERVFFHHKWRKLVVPLGRFLFCIFFGLQMMSCCLSLGLSLLCFVSFSLFVISLSLRPRPFVQPFFGMSLVLSTCPLHVISGCGKERRILIGPWWPAKKAALVRNYLEVYWPCAGGLSAVNAIGTQLRDNGILVK